MFDTDEGRDDGRPWGFMNGGVWVCLPKEPLLLGGFGPPPFDVTLPSGVVRHVVHDPEETPDDPHGDRRTPA